MTEYTIKLNKVYKEYPTFLSRTLLVENLFKNYNNKPFNALTDINLKLKKGDRLGILGRNGSGKTTLLKVIAGITKPTRGDVDVTGKVISLIELEAGFHPEFNGYENIKLNGMLIGMSREKIEMSMNDIVEFSGIGEFVHMPLYTYSSGMKLRLGFAIAAYSEPDILVLDENMSVGDKDFRKKSFSKIKEFSRSGSTIVMATHSLSILRKLCNKALIIEKGKIVYLKDTKSVINRFWKLYGK